MTRVFNQYRPPQPTTGTHKAHEPQGQRGDQTQSQQAQRGADGFGKPVANVAAALEGVVTQRTPAQLAASAKAILDASALPEAFATALTVHGPELHQSPTLTGDQQAQRMFEFAGQFASRLTELTQAAPRPEVAKAMVETLVQAGAQHVIDRPTGRTGVELAQQIFAANSAEQVAATLEGLVLTRAGAQAGVPLALQIQVAVPTVTTSQEAAETKARRRGTFADGARTSLRLLGEYVQSRSTAKWTREERRLIGRALGILALVMFGLAVLAVLALT